MAHKHSDHDHYHHHVNTRSITTAFWLGIILNILFVFIEFVASFFTNSLSLMADAGHNLSDVAALGLSLFAFKISQSRSTQKFTYGYHKSTILASLINATILFIVAGSVGWAAITRFFSPQETPGKSIAIVAAVGIIINTFSALLFFRQKEKDINIKGAYLHLMTDALISTGVVVGGIIIYYTGYTWIDPLISILIMLIVVYSTWDLLKESLFLSLDAVPKEIDIEKIKSAALNIEGIKNIHHIHIWAMSTSKNALTAHIVVDESKNWQEIEKIKHTLKHTLEHLYIQHITLEVEPKICLENACEKTTD